MNGAGKVRRSVPISTAVGIHTSEVNVVVEGLDASNIPGSFSVHLLKDGQRIASRFFVQPSVGSSPAASSGADQLAHFDFTLPIDVVKDGKFSVEIVPLNPIPAGEPSLSERIGQPTLSVYLMLEE
jgi:hypothetical protein